MYNCRENLQKMIQQIFLFQLYLSFSILNSILSIILDM